MSSPRRNRVDPDGAIRAHAGRGLLTGNRGVIHDADGVIRGRRWTTRAWICCRLDWKDRRRDPAPPGRWTMLFFLDEAAALAAGHRPCFFCRRDAATGFARSFALAEGRSGRAAAAEMDAALHAARLGPKPRIAGDAAPRGAMLVDAAGRFLLRVGGGVRACRWTGYGPEEPAPREARLLTPPESCGALRAGYRPVLHPSAEA